jgi:hypothetical protein
MKKPNLHKGRIYLKDGVWVVQYKIIERVRGGSPKQLGNYKLQPKINYVPIRSEDAARLNDPYDQGKETCFELILVNEPRNEFQEVRFVADTKPVWYAKLWPVSEMVQDLQHYFETTPQEKIDEDWKKVEELDLVGPTVEEFLNIKSVNMAYEKKPHKIFIKGRKYKTDKTVVLCTKTTCNYSTEHFQGVVLESKEYATGRFSKTWIMERFEEVIEEKVGSLGEI